MKSIFKLIPAVLAGIVLVGCSSDDLYTNGEQPIEYTANDLEVNFTPFEEEGITRAAWSNNQLSSFQDGDAIRVYDESLTKFDKYTFGDGKFTKAADTKIGKATFALFPSKYVSYGEWKENGDVIAVIQVPSVIKYDASSEIANGDEIAYVSEVPAFGTPTDKGTHLAVDNLTALTAIYRVTLNGIKGNHNFLKIQAANSYLSGKFDAVLTDATPQLVQSKDLVGKNYIIVDLQSVPSTRTVLYIPIIPGDYPVASNQFTVQLSDDSQTSIWTAAAKADPETVVSNPTAWMDLTPAVSGDKTFKVNQVRGLTRAFELNVTTTEELSRLLKNDKNLTGDVAYQLKELDINRNEDFTDYTIEVPNMKANSLTIGVTELKNTLTTEQKLVIKHADAEDPYTQKVVLNVTTINNAGGGETPVEIDLPECDVQIIGDYTNCKNITIKAAKSLTFGDGNATTTVPNDVTTEQNTSTYVSTIKESITVTANATLGKAFTIVGANTGKNATFNVNIEGVTKAIVARYSDVKVSGDGQIGGTLYAYGNVTVESSQNTAISNLQYAGTGKTLDLKKGGISVIKTAPYASTSEVPNPLNTLTITNVETGKSQIGDIQDNQTIGGDATKVLDVTFEKSVWNGEATTSTSMKNPAKIYTASQLASVEGDKDSYTLMTNIDLNNKPYAGFAMEKGTFDGNNKTIENLALTGEGEVSAGLFKAVTITDNLIIKDLTIKDITTTGVVAAGSDYPYAIGGVIGVLTLADGKNVTLDNVEINSTNNDFGVSYVQTGYVGGLIGQVIGSAAETGQVIIKGKVDKSTVVLKSIKGHAYLGGLVGGVAKKSAAISISDYKVTLTDGFSVNIASDIDTDYSYPEYGTVGMYIGQARGTVVYDAANETNSINGKREALGFKYNHVTTGSPLILYRYYGSNKELGYSPLVTQVTEGTTTASAVSPVYKTLSEYYVLLPKDKLNPNIFIKSNDYPADVQ